MPPPNRKTYDHRIREHVWRTGLHPSPGELHLPPTTIRSWRRRPPPKVVCLDDSAQEAARLRERVIRTEVSLLRLIAVLRLLIAVMRVAGLRLDHLRLPEGDSKALLLHSVAASRAQLPLSACLRVLRLAPSRFHAWTRRDRACRLDDRPSCPRTRPTSLTAIEISNIRDLVHDPSLRHLSLTALSLFAQRMGSVFAAPGTWFRLARERNWIRPRTRVHPIRPVTGVRALRPNQLWHLDVTIIRLLDGTKTYLHAVIDNFSRKVLSWRLQTRLDPATTGAVLVEASRLLHRASGETTLIADSGVENVNHIVDASLLALGIRRVLAQVEVSWSNSMIEAFWRSLKHNWLYLNHLDSLAHLEQLVAFYVNEHNTRMPHSALQGRTPDEAFHSGLASAPPELVLARAAARRARLETNRLVACGACTTLVTLDAGLSKIPH